MRVEDLERELRAERPEPDLDFARRLDEWAEAGFPRDRGLGPLAAERKGGLQRAWERLSATPARRMLLPAGAVATVVVVAGVAISRHDPDHTGLSGSASTPTTEQASPAEDAASDGGAATPGAADSAVEAAPSLELDSGDPGIARGTDERIVDAGARLSLGAEADEVQEAANGVVEVTDRYDGVVVDSQVTSDVAGARASFELELPYSRLDAALADLSELGDVISRTETTEDITPQAVRARKDLADLHERIRDARIELIKADTREQRLILRSQIASLEASADAAEAELNGVVRQGRFATVEVTIRSDGPADEDGGWSLGDAFDDAGRVLEVIGGIALVALAVLVPLALVAALAAFGISRARGQARERALDA